MVFVRYIGAQWSDGTVFDGNYNSQITPFKLNGVIKGWTQGLKGKKVGSRVELVIPANLAYGDEGKNGSPKGTLVFVVDILAAAPTVSPSPLTPNSSQSTIAVSSASPHSYPPLAWRLRLIPPNSKFYSSSADKRCTRLR